MVFGVPLIDFLACVAVSVVQSLATQKCIRDYRKLES
jgi:hypothetical protein